uniref:Exostosin GT47 domain-containing protein n=1 Tax=Aureoumbra lagunensis TaxID=44058 RepID=A0A7S3JZY3_9STRA|mmetsp:Transcript_23528/g.30595  ORF Transcript_23528/g.30595 Transcript_23528/m.30595 type:complete len:394 (+) Transcript_23528:264-1445(+)|eukprot:CAMPEP_0197292826 /NCGR_PEP_ID=MMETSP0890-20130614/25277_1 /TAXON_ID=44058 ORGANISM="Aureoumbra lagunensis, Strain CCMP1510" /NCGR_SAMPLE_ID=MMETSP0890 /ASSEMBLY_ACC=CAM_ASM_000533 /LENGTH=393 /DNA_ID=CAMNT_0042767023 /DNA_START=262 /DNA_END=1443 /DNA_ORIENTATION=+
MFKYLWILCGMLILAYARDGMKEKDLILRNQEARKLLREEEDACLCPQEMKTNVTSALVCAEVPLRFWINLHKLRCRLWCCTRKLTIALDWMPLVHWHRGGMQAFEPIIGMHTLVHFSDGILKKISENKYIAKVAPHRAPRNALVLSLALSSGIKTNISAALQAALIAATIQERERIIIIAHGDVSFPRLNLPSNIQVWATNLSPGPTQQNLKPIPIGISSGPSTRWVTTILHYLEQASSHNLPRRELLFCNGYRADAQRTQQLQKLNANGFTYCAPLPKLRAQQYWERLLAAKTVFCPRGFGVATFRTYEAILAQAIPIFLHYPPHTDLFRDLPVIAVNDLHSLTPVELQNTYNTIRKNLDSYDFKRAFAPFWIAQLARATIDTLSISTSVL